MAFGAPDDRTGTERLVVAAELRDMSSGKKIEADIARAVDEAMGMPPDVIELLPPQSIPKTSSGKLRRSETRRLYMEGKLGRKQQAPWVQIARLAVRGAAPRAWSWTAADGAQRCGNIVWRLFAGRFRGDSDSAMARGGTHAQPAACG